MRGAAAFPLALLAGASTGLPAPPSDTTPASLCEAGERVVYACRMREDIASLCLGANAIRYRFRAGAGAEVEVASAADWENVRVGGNRSQGGLNQDHVRLTREDTHYVIHAGETGSLNEDPGRRVSGIVILRGDSAQDEVARLECETGAGFDDHAFHAISGAAPPGWDGREAVGGPFDAIY